MHPEATGIVSFWTIDGEPYRAPLEIPVSALCIALRRDGRYLLTGDAAFQARQWDLNENEIVSEFSSLAPIVVIDVSPVDDSIMMAGSYDGTVRLWNLRTGRSLGPPLRHRDMVRSAVFSPDGTTVFSGALDAAQLWDISAATRVATRPVHAPTSYPLAFDQEHKVILVHDGDFLQCRAVANGRPIGKALPQPESVICAAFDAKVERAVVIEAQHKAFLRNLETGETIRELTHLSERAVCTAIRRDGVVAVGFFDGVTALYDARAGTPLDRVVSHKLHTGPVFSVQFHGERLLTGGADGFARLWQVATGNQLKQFPHPTACSAVFSPDGSLIATTGVDQHTRIWTIAGELTCAPLRHPSATWVATFSSDGRTLLTGCEDGNARFWDVATARQLGPAMTHGEQVIRGAFWPDEETVLTSTGPSHFNSPLGEPNYHRIPAPVQGDAKDITLWVQTITGMEIVDNRGATVLQAHDWRMRNEKLDHKGFAP